MLNEIASTGLTLLFAGLVKGVFGLGLPAVSMGLLALFMQPVEAAALLVVPGLVTNLWQFASGPERFMGARRLFSLLIGIAVGTVVGIGVLSSRSRWAQFALGGVLVVYATIALFLPPVQLSARFGRRLSPLVGITTGMISGATGVAAVPLVPYLNSLGLSREVLMQSMGLAFAICTFALSLCLAWTGHLHLASIGASVLAIVPAVAGMAIGTRLRQRLHPEVYRKWFLAGLFLLGAYNGIRAVI